MAMIVSHKSTDCKQRKGCLCAYGTLHRHQCNRKTIRDSPPLHPKNHATGSSLAEGVADKIAAHLKCTQARGLTVAVNVGILPTVAEVALP